MNPLVQVLKRFKGRRVAVLGDFVADIFIYGEISRISREAPVLVLNQRDTQLVPGGGANAVHNLHMLCGEIAAVQAIASHAVRAFPVEDTVAINLQFANGALGSFMLSDTAACPRSWEQTSQENKAYPSYDDEDCYVIAGTNGSLSVPTLRLKTYPRPEDRSWWKPFDVGTVPMKREDPIVRQMEHFGAVVRGEAEPLVSARDGLANLRVTEAITEAAKSGGIVRL